MQKTYDVAAPNRLITVPEPGILFTRDNARFAWYALKDAREAGRSIPEQDELCDELAALLFPAAGETGLAFCRKDMNLRHPVGQCPHDDDSPFREGEMIEYVSRVSGPGPVASRWVPGVFSAYSGTVAGQGLLVRSVRDAVRGLRVDTCRSTTEVRRISPEVISAARSWIADCEWEDAWGDDIADLTDFQVVAGVQKFYAGGWPQFRQDGGEDDPIRDDPAANYQDGPCGDH